MKMDSVMRIGTRKSALALAQTRLFIECCRRADKKEQIRYEIVEMHTEGDRILDRPLYQFEGKGMFVSVFEKALAEGSIHVAVHSGKDMPIRLPEGLAIGAVLPRGNPRDVLVTAAGKKLPEHPVIGTGSLRRQQQTAMYLGYGTKGIRGNVNTRLRKLQEGEVDGLILAAAGLERLGIREDDGFQFQELETEQFLPAAAQGIIAIEARQDGPFGELLEAVNHKDTMDSFLAERAYLEGIGAGCQQPVAAYSWCREGKLYMEAACWQDGVCRRSSGQAEPGQGEQLGRKLAEQILYETEGIRWE